jgi:hypothetical protein
MSHNSRDLIVPPPHWQILSNRPLRTRDFIIRPRQWKVTPGNRSIVSYSSGGEEDGIQLARPLTPGSTFYVAPMGQATFYVAPMGQALYTNSLPLHIRSRY